MSRQNINKLVLGLSVATIAGVRLARRLRRMEMKGKVVLITGGSRGLGFAMAEEFGRLGAKVALCARDMETLQRAKQLLHERGVDVSIYSCDVTYEADVRSLVQKVEQELGAIDVLVNNAGRIEVGPVQETTKDDYQKALATHFWGPWHTIREVLPAMRARRSGRIVNISSIGGRLGVPHLVPYDASKFALAGYSEALTAELRGSGVRVTTVFPGLMRTGSPRHANFKGKNEKEYGWFAVSDAAPLLTVSARRAARKIVDACIHGDATLVLTPAAKLAILAHGIVPDLVIESLGLINRFLPAPGGIGKSAAKGLQSESAMTRSPLTALNRKAERELNQVTA